MDTRPDQEHDSAMRGNSRLLFGVLLLAGSLTASPSAGASIAGKACGVVGARTVSRGILYECVKTKVGGRTVTRWNAGRRCSTAAENAVVGAVTYGCRRSGSTWVWFKQPTAAPTPTPTPTLTPTAPAPITYPTLTLPNDFTILSGGDVDVSPFTDARLGVSGWRTGGGAKVGSNATPDNYLNLAITSNRVVQIPAPFHAVLSITYIDQGSDSLAVQYDASAGPWSQTRLIRKSNTGEIRKAEFNICDGGFQKRQNGGDIRIDDANDGAEFITGVELRYLPAGARTWRVDDYGANPRDDLPDSDAIQAVLNATCSGDTVLFTAGTEGVADFRGYLIDKTIKLIGNSPKDHVVYTSSDPQGHSLMKATPQLLGFVMRLWGKGSLDPGVAGRIDYVTLERIDFDGNRQARKCTGSDGESNGVDDNWGSSDPGDLMEVGNPGTLPGGIMMDGGSDHLDAKQDYTRNPDLWSRDFVIQDLTIKNIECGTALVSFDSAHSTIQRVTVTNSGEHHHVVNDCAVVDNDNEPSSWADGMTVGGPDLTVRDNHVTNPSDVGIVTFGGRGQQILNNRIETTAGNYGTFAGIHVQVGLFGDLSDLLIEGNTISNDSNPQCGGMHIGIALSSMVFSSGCMQVNGGTQYGSQWGSEYGKDGGCNYDDLVEKPVAGRCPIASWCTTWLHADPGHPIILRNNRVTGAQVNYTVGYVDGPLLESNNLSINPRDTDFDTAANCRGRVITPTDKMAYLPKLPGWTEFGLTCWA